MNLIAVAAPQQHTEVAPTSSNGSALITVANCLDGAAILSVLAVMVVAGLFSAKMLPKATTQSKPAIVRINHPAN